MVKSSPESIENLVEQAIAMRDKAYAPYSNYHVGCAIVAGGEIFLGANVENASHGLTMCAERTAVAQAILAGKRHIEYVVVATDSTPPAAPCGMCRQTLNEFSSQDDALVVLSVSTKGHRQEYTLEELFPYGFSEKQLKSSQEGTLENG